MADEADSKSVVGNHVRVQVPLPALENTDCFGVFFILLRFSMSAIEYQDKMLYSNYVWGYVNNKG